MSKNLEIKEKGLEILNLVKQNDFYKYAFNVKRDIQDNSFNPFAGVSVELKNKIKSFISQFDDTYQLQKIMINNFYTILQGGSEELSNGYCNAGACRRELERLEKDLTNFFEKL